MRTALRRRQPIALNAVGDRRALRTVTPWRCVPVAARTSLSQHATGAALSAKVSNSSTSRHDAVSMQTLCLAQQQGLGVRPLKQNVGETGGLTKLEGTRRMRSGGRLPPSVGEKIFIGAAIAFVAVVGLVFGGELCCARLRFCPAACLLVMEVDTRGAIPAAEDSESAVDHFLRRDIKWSCAH